MKWGHLSRVCFMLLFTSCFVSCNDDKKTEEVYPIRFSDSSYEVRMGMRESISFVDGSGDYTIDVENPQLLDASISLNTDNLFINAKKKGETVLSVTDNRVGETVKLKIKITDSYLGFVLVNSDLPFFKSKTDLFLVKNDLKEFYLFDQAEDFNGPVGDPVLKGNYKIAIENNKPYLTLVYKDETEGVEIRKFCLSGSDGIVFDILNTMFELGWEKLSENSSRSVGPQIYVLHLTEVNTIYEADGYMNYFMHIPGGILR
ncbi:hypothetical protein [uncultured Sanguibacteroides sp.]|uniref:hypothetical protein n=1 Tax=uncultured Sanguibacteroides sp. TaxID=1635151 RepID=UPI0025F28E8D|nr:hypothetical protein [uncultured Sanguibacteroides sp.]